MSEYVLEVGKKGFDRLKFINIVFGEHSRNLLRRAGIGRGNRILEIGCGTGSMTTWLAEQVGAEGRVVAVDASDKQLEIARKAAQEAGSTNIEFIRSTVESLELPNDSFDMAYCRLLLMHLKDPSGTLARMKKYLRPRGVIVCEEPHASSLTTSPRNESIERLNGLFLQLGKLQGLDFDIGDKLLTLLASAGYLDAHAYFVQPVISMRDAVDFVLMGAREIAPVAVKVGLATEEDAQRTLSELQNSASVPGAYYTFPRQAQVYACKAGSSS
jgi:ubiquinone/menaquinone biosynthesis C-methylase UbiE